MESYSQLLLWHWNSLKQAAQYPLYLEKMCHLDTEPMWYTSSISSSYLETDSFLKCSLDGIGLGWFVSIVFSLRLLVIATWKESLSFHRILAIRALILGSSEYLHWLVFVFLAVHCGSNFGSFPKSVCKQQSMFESSSLMPVNVSQLPLWNIVLKLTASLLLSLWILSTLS